MLGIEIHWTGDLRWLKEAIERTQPSVLQARVFDPWMRWVTKWRIPEMYRHGGRVSGGDGQMQWRALSASTKEAKEAHYQKARTRTSKYTGHQIITSLSDRYQPLVGKSAAESTMMKAYRIVSRRLSGFGYRFVISNEARSKSKWSPGFDYPSALHTGWPAYDVYPRADGPGFLAWQLKGGDWAFARHTHPKGAPGRPHIRFFGYDVAKLGKLALEYILTGRTTELGNNEPMA